MQHQASDSRDVRPVVGYRRVKLLAGEGHLPLGELRDHKFPLCLLAVIHGLSIIATGSSLSPTHPYVDFGIAVVGGMVLFFIFICLLVRR